MLSLLAAYLHRIDPFAIEFPDRFPITGIRWYGLSYILGFVIGYLLIRRVTKVGRSTLKPDKVGDLVFALVIGAVVGGRLGYVLLYRPDLLWQFADRFPFWGVLAINEGGMASHGGMIGAVIACLYYARRRGHSWPHLLDLSAFAAPLGLFFGRIANFVNGELIGRPVRLNVNLPWAVKFPQEMFEWNEPQLAKLPPDLSDLGSLDAIIAQVQRGNQAVIQAVEPLLTPRHPSQIYAALLEGLVVFLVLAILWTKPRRPGIVGGTFLLVYGLVRIFDEMFREPDAHIGYQWLGLTRGQWLSTLLVLTGIVLIVVFRRRNVEPMGGWYSN